MSARKNVVWGRKMEHYKIKKSGPHTFQNHCSSISNDKTETVRTILIFYFFPVEINSKRAFFSQGKK